MDTEHQVEAKNTTDQPGAARTEEEMVPVLGPAIPKAADSAAGHANKVMPQKGRLTRMPR